MLRSAREGGPRRSKGFLDRSPCPPLSLLFRTHLPSPWAATSRRLSALSWSAGRTPCGRRLPACSGCLQCAAMPPAAAAPRWTPLSPASTTKQALLQALKATRGQGTCTGRGTAPGKPGHMGAWPQACPPPHPIPLESPHLPTAFSLLLCRFDDASDRPCKYSSLGRSYFPQPWHAVPGCCCVLFPSTTLSSRVQTPSPRGRGAGGAGAQYSPARRCAAATPLAQRAFLRPRPVRRSLCVPKSFPTRARPAWPPPPHRAKCTVAAPLSPLESNQPPSPAEFGP